MIFRNLLIFPRELTSLHRQKDNYHAVGRVAIHNSLPLVRPPLCSLSVESHPDFRVGVPQNELCEVKAAVGKMDGNDCDGCPKLRCPGPPPMLA